MTMNLGEDRFQPPDVQLVSSEASAVCAAPRFRVSVAIRLAVSDAPVSGGWTVSGGRT